MEKTKGDNNIHTTAYLSTRGRNTGSVKSALSVGSCRRPSFSPLKSSLSIIKLYTISRINKHGKRVTAKDLCDIRAGVSNSLEVGVVKN